MPLLAVGGLAVAIVIVAAIVGSGANPLAGPSARGAAAMNAARRQIQGQGGKGGGRPANTGRDTIGTLLGFGTEQSPSGYSAPPDLVMIAPAPGGPGTTTPPDTILSTVPSGSFTAAPPPADSAPWYSWVPGMEGDANSIATAENTPGANTNADPTQRPGYNPNVAPGQTPIFYADPATGNTSPTPVAGWTPIY